MKKITLSIRYQDDDGIELGAHITTATLADRANSHVISEQEMTDIIAAIAQQTMVMNPPVATVTVKVTAYDRSGNKPVDTPSVLHNFPVRLAKIIGLIKL